MSLAVEVNNPMYFLDMASLEVRKIFVTHESQSGNTVETGSGERYRTCTQGHKIFFNEPIALQESDALMLQRRNAVEDMARLFNI